MARRRFWKPVLQVSGVPAGGWQIIYTGFILIMLSFFILLTSFASLEPSRITRFVTSFSKAVNVLSGGKSIDPDDTIHSPEISVLPTHDLTSQLFEQVRRISMEEQLDHVRLHRTDAGVVMTLSDTLLFDSARAELSASAYPLMEKIARLMDRIAVPVEIGGHTDDRPIRTDAYPSNWELSTARAVSVLRYLQAHRDIDPQRLSAVGYAQYQPVVANDSAEHRAMNRRVEFVFLVER